MTLFSIMYPLDLGTATEHLTRVTEHTDRYRADLEAEGLTASDITVELTKVTEPTVFDFPADRYAFRVTGRL